jgi:uncharacterized OB-fold protein
MTSVAEEGTGRILAWRDSIPLHYEYSAGVAGEGFLARLREGKIVASKCPRCGDLRLPPRIYCLLCYARTSSTVEISHAGRLVSVSMPAGRVADGTGEGMAFFGFVAFAGVSGGLFHRVGPSGGKAPRAGDTVWPLFKPTEERRGSILDLECFVVPPRRSGNR